MALFRRGGATEEERRRLPPGQHLVRNFPVLHAGTVPYTEPPPDWDFRVRGAVERPIRLDLEELRALPSVTRAVDIHCVTTWTKLDTIWEGVPVADVLQTAGVLPDATHVVAHGEEGYTANMPLAAVLDDDALLAYRYDGRELDPEHGRPLRLLVPSLYFWKSAKWLRGLEVIVGDRLGFWENYGYSNSADPWREERYAF
jgi:DMSO/TMAO reductase YedYZ molybdopterin-dependent catalytic subunit